MNSYRWTVRVGLVGVGFLVTLAGLVAGLVTFKVAVLGVEPDGWALSAIAALPFIVGVVLVATAVSALLETVVRRMGSTKDYRWTVRVGLGGVGFLATLVAFVAVTRIFNVVIAGVQPEAWALTAMMTAPLTIGVVSLATVGTAVVETVARLKRTEVGA